MEFFIQLDKNILILGSIINAVAIILGGLAGLLLRSRLPAKIIETSFNGFGLFTLFLGLMMVGKSANYLTIIFSLLMGIIVGELFGLEEFMKASADKLKNRFSSEGSSFVDGLVTSSLLFCMGSMAILGSIEEGLGGFPNLLLTKSTMDGFASLALSASMGGGVSFSAAPVFIYQGILTLLAGSLQGAVSETLINDLGAVGGIMLMAISLNILEIKKIRVLNMLPCLIFAVIFSLMMS